MWLSSTAQQAIHAVFCIASPADDGPVRVDEIAAVLGCPRNYLSKTLHVLSRAGVLRSGRGPHGGFRLAAPPDRVTIAQVVAPFRPVDARRCLMGRDTCGGRTPCAAHERWSRVLDSVDAFFGTTTIAMLLGDNPRARTSARNAITTLRHSNRRGSHGSVAR